MNLITNKTNDIYTILAHYYSPESIQCNVPTNRLLLLGEANKDLRCIMFSYSWDHNPEYASLDLNTLDGKNEETEEYILKTLDQFMIEKAIIDSENDLKKQ
ncbi:MAG: hypothetical protein E7591_08860 [Ruminococcaceae bacterium]|nr:hypothetical protein [Oscillospiraceae bacterium]